MAEDKNIDNREDVRYDSNDIMTLDWNEHVRLRPGMYIGKLGDGTHDDDGIYVILKEVLDNSIDEYAMGYGKQIDVTITDEGEVTVRDYGRGIPLDKVFDVSSKMNTSGKFDSSALTAWASRLLMRCRQRLSFRRFATARARR